MMNFPTIVLLAIIGVAAASHLALDKLFDAEWQYFKVRHDKQYDNVAHEQFRKKVFLQNSHMIAQHNIKHAKGEVSYSLRMNQFGDMLHQEFVSTMNGLLRSNRTHLGSPWTEQESLSIPKSIDWRKKGAVTPVKNQGHCESCWSFSATGALEGQLFIKTGKLVSLSEQNLIDCSTEYGNNGCAGGLMDNAFAYIRDNNGIDTEEAYPYLGKKSECRYNAKDKGATDTGFVDIPSGNEKALTRALAKIGPVSVAIDASHESFQFYSDGVYDAPNCDRHALDHGVLAVGYDTTEDGVDYYIVKNSWGTRWGKDGYVLIARNNDNECGIATQASYPLV